METITKTLIKFNTLEELMAATEGHQLTAQELINGRTYINGEGWQDIELSKELKEEILQLIVETLGGHQRTKNDILNTLRYSRPQHWGLRRIFIQRYNEQDREIYVSYCAGQDYTSETQTIRNFLKR